VGESERVLKGRIDWRVFRCFFARVASAHEKFISQMRWWRMGGWGGGGDERHKGGLEGEYLVGSENDIGLSGWRRPTRPRKLDRAILQIPWRIISFNAIPREVRSAGSRLASSPRGRFGFSWRGIDRVGPGESPCRLPRAPASPGSSEFQGKVERRPLAQRLT
jgi:hypothetical protein